MLKLVDSELPIACVTSVDEFKNTSSSFDNQAGDFGCLKCPSCAKLYISLHQLASETPQQVPSIKDKG